jgi:hypothetical protein
MASLFETDSLKMSETHKPVAQGGMNDDRSPEGIGEAGREQICSAAVGSDRGGMACPGPALGGRPFGTSD